MKIICREIFSYITKKKLGATSPWLTIDKEYLVLALEMSFKEGLNFLIQSDNYGEPIFQSIMGFEITSEYIPSNWLISVDKNRGAIMTMPKSWQYENFFDDLENEKNQAIELFNREVEIIHSEEIAYKES